jgi:capsular exopolysaccharide synthesis family protein
MSDLLPGQSRLIVEASEGMSAITEVDYADLVYRYFLRRWYLYVLGIGLALTATYFYLKTQQDEYAITARFVILENEENYQPDDLLRRSTALYAASQNVYNEIERITSFELMRSVVGELNLQYGYWMERGLARTDGYRDFPVVIDTFVAASSEPVDLSFRIDPVDYSHFRLYHEDTLVATYPFDSLFTNTYGTFRLTLNGALPKDDDISLHVSITDPRVVTEAYLDGLEAEFTGINSTTVRLRIDDAVPARGVDILTELMRNYNETKLAEAEAAALQTLGFIDDRLTQAREQLQLVESNLERYKLSNQISDETNSDLGLVFQNVDQFGQEKEELSLQISALASLQGALSESNDEPQLIAIDNSIPTAGQIHEQVQLYNRLALERKELLVSGQPDNPAVTSISRRIGSLQDGIERSVTNQRQRLDERLSLVQSQYDRALGQLRSVPTKQREVQDRSREQQIVENLYVYLLQKKEETALAYVNDATTAKIIDSAHASTLPVSPNKKLYYFLSLIVGGAIPFFFSVAREEVFNTQVETLEDVKRIFPNLTMAGQISRGSGKNRLPVADSTRTEISDQFRSLRNSLFFHFPGGRQTLMVTSANKGEGKSFTATNLAISCARAQRRVVIIDFDFYNPQVANYLGHDGSKGLSNFLSGDATASEVVHPTEEKLGLHYLPAGQHLKNPGDLVSNERGLEDLFAYLHDRFDVIIIDVPPVGMLTDAVLLNRFIDGSLYVIRAGVSTKTSLKQGKRIMEAGQLKNPLLVFNSVEPGQHRYYT